MATMESAVAADWSRGVSNAWSNVAAFVPKFVAFLVILIIGYIVAKAIEKILDKVLQRVGFDRLVERGGIKRALSRSQYDAAGILGRLVFYAVMLFVLSTAFGVFGTNPISTYLRSVIAYLPKVFVAILIIVIAAAVAAAVKTLIQDTLGGLSYGSVVANAASVLIIVFGVIAALNQLEIARNVVNALLYFLVATVGGILVVAVGGGGIQPMQQRWQRALARIDEEAPRMRAQAQQAPSARDQARQKAQQAREATSGDTGGSTPGSSVYR